MVVFFDCKKLLLEIHADTVPQYFLEPTTKAEHLFSSICVRSTKLLGFVLAEAYTCLVHITDLNIWLDSALEHLKDIEQEIVSFFLLLGWSYQERTTAVTIQVLILATNRQEDRV